MADVTRLADENEKLHLAVNELSVLNDIATAISSTQPLDEVVDQIVVKCIKHLEAEEGAISLLEKEPGKTEDDERFQTMIRRQDTSSERVPIKLDSHITGWMLKYKEPLLSNDIQNDSRFQVFKDKYESFKSILCVPLKIKGDLIGYLAVFNKKGDKSFTEADQRLLSIIGSQSAQVIENARLYEEEKALISLQEEMRLAKEIQLKLLPDQNPQLDGYRVCATNIPAKAVGGDYYDFIDLPGPRIAFCVGDITGKGMPAAMLMSNLQASLRSQAIQFEECCNCLESVNEALYRSTDPEKFATLFYGILNTEKHRVTYSNGGHNPPLHITSEGEVNELKSTGMLLGVLEQTGYENGSLSLLPGDLLVVYSDGITESMNHEEEAFGEERLIKLLREYHRQSAGELVETILDEIKEHAQDTPQSDDITLMIIQKL